MGRRSGLIKCANCNFGITPSPSGEGNRSTNGQQICAKCWIEQEMAHRKTLEMKMNTKQKFAGWSDSTLIAHYGRTNDIRIIDELGRRAG